MSSINDIARLRAEERAIKRRNSLTEKRKAFDEAKRLEWQQIKAAHDDGQVEIELAAIRQQMARVMFELRQQGVTKRQLGEAYGTKDARTINELLDSAILEASTTHVSIQPVSLEDVELQTYQVDVNNYDGWSGTVYVYEDEDGDCVVLTDRVDPDFIGSTLHMEIAGGTSGDFADAWAQR